ncbi:MAG: hypothetical protein Q8L48_13070 [Archangium sp.]|nr:hypothetical protein [Archangium sp.]
MRDGYLVLGRWGGVTVRLHLLAPLIWLFYVGNAASVPGALLGLVVLIFVHEVGHAVLVRRNGGWVQSIDFLPFGGECSWHGSVSPVGESVIAWGGVLAQALLLAVVNAMLLVTGRPHEPFLGSLVHSLTVTNLFMIGLNLLPIPPLDGSRAWLLIPRGLARLRKPRRFEDVRPSASRSWWQRLVSRFRRRKLRVVDTPPPNDRKYLN